MTTEQLKIFANALFGEQRLLQPACEEHPGANEDLLKVEPASGPVSKMDFAVMHAFEEQWRVFPLYGTHGKTCDCSLGIACEQPGQHPRIRSWHRRATDHCDVLISWWNTSGWQRSNVGVATGRYSDLVVLEAENTADAAADQNLKSFCQRFHWRPETLTVRTGCGGLQLYFRAPDWLEFSSADNVAQGISIRGENDYVVVEGSRYPNGGKSSVVQYGPILRPTLPLILLPVMQRGVPRRLDRH